MKKIKLNRSRAHRQSLEKNLVRSLFLEEGISTTEAKAKWVRSSAEHYLSIAKKGTLESLRRLISETGSKEVAKKIIELSKKLTNRNSGYLRLTKVGIRVGDKAVITKVGFIFDEVKKETKEAVKKPRARKTKASTEVKKVAESNKEVAK
jgi:large subunit ribosomal protein L17